MLRDERQAALSDVIVACEDAADGHDDAAGLIEDQDPALAAFLRESAARRRAAAADLERHLRELGDLPRAPDPDRETVGSLVRHLKAALSTDERATLLQERESAEAEIGQRIATALEMELPEPAKESLRQLQRAVTEAMQRLAAARANP